MSDETCGNCKHSVKHWTPDRYVCMGASAAVDDEQFAPAVHDGEAWQRVRTCRMVPVSLYDEEGVDGIECDECGWSDVHEWYDPMPRYCPNCGAKVVAE